MIEISVISKSFELQKVNRRSDLIRMNQMANLALIRLKSKCKFIVLWSILISLGTFPSSHAAADALSDLIKKFNGKPAEPEVTAKDARPTSSREPASYPGPKTKKSLEVKSKKKEVVAQPPTTQAASVPQEEPKTLLGSWGGAKSGLGDAGIDINLRYRADLIRNVSGGKEIRGAYLGHVDLSADLDLDKIFGLSQTSLFVYGIADHGDHPSEFVGDSFATSNIDAPSTGKLYEMYVSRKFSEQFVILAGLRDLNADFYATESSGAFINSAFGVSPSLAKTGFNGPSIFPTTSLAVSTKYTAENSFYFQSAVFNGRSGDPNSKYGTQIYSGTDQGLLLIAETGVNRSNGGYRTKIGLGSWTYTKQSDAIDTNRTAEDNSGFYAMIDQSLSEHIAVFGKIGTASEVVSQFRTAYEVGALASGLFESRPDDQFGVGLAYAQASSDYATVNSKDEYEIAHEVFYRATITDGLAVVPDVQWIVNPGLDPALENAVTIGTRIEFQF